MHCARNYNSASDPTVASITFSWRLWTPFSSSRVDFIRFVKVATETVQLSGDILPGGEYGRPDGHGVHDFVPLFSENCPEGQSLHAFPFWDHFPALHLWHAVFLPRDPSPAAQFLHLVAPFIADHFPAMQLEHPVP